MRAHRLEVTVPPSGELQLRKLPFQPGEAVEIIILALEDATNGSGQLEDAWAGELMTRRRLAKNAQHEASSTARRRRR